MKIKELKDTILKHIGVDFESGPKIENYTQLFATFSISKPDEIVEYPITIGLLIPKKGSLPLEIVYYFQTENKDTLCIYEHLNEINNNSNLKGTLSIDENYDYHILIKYTSIYFKPYDIPFVLNSLESAMEEFSLEEVATHLFELLKNPDVISN